MLSSLIAALKGKDPVGVICENNKAILEAAKEKRKKDEEARRAQCRGVYSAMMDFIRNPDKRGEDKHDIILPEGLCDFEEMLTEVSGYSNIQVIVDRDSLWHNRDKSCYTIKRTAGENKVLYEIYMGERWWRS